MYTRSSSHTYIITLGTLSLSLQNLLYVSLLLFCWALQLNPQNEMNDMEVNKCIFCFRNVWSLTTQFPNNSNARLQEVIKRLLYWLNICLYVSEATLQIYFSINKTNYTAAFLWWWYILLEWFQKYSVKYHINFIKIDMFSSIVISQSFNFDISEKMKHKL